VTVESSNMPLEYFVDETEDCNGWKSRKIQEVVWKNFCTLNISSMKIIYGTSFIYQSSSVVMEVNEI
jgi:hypothetical protein